MELAAVCETLREELYQWDDIVLTLKYSNIFLARVIFCGSFLWACQEQGKSIILFVMVLRLSQKAFAFIIDNLRTMISNLS